MEQEIKLSIRKEFNGTHWVVYLNKTVIGPMFTDEVAANVAVKLYRSAARGFAAEISRQLGG